MIAPNLGKLFLRRSLTEEQGEFWEECVGDILKVELKDIIKDEEKASNGDNLEAMVASLEAYTKRAAELLGNDRVTLPMYSNAEVIAHYTEKQVPKFDNEKYNTAQWGSKENKLSYMLLRSNDPLNKIAKFYKAKLPSFNQYHDNYSEGYLILNGTLGKGVKEYGEGFNEYIESMTKFTETFAGNLDGEKQNKKDLEGIGRGTLDVLANQNAQNEEFVIVQSTPRVQIFTLDNTSNIAIYYKAN